RNQQARASTLGRRFCLKIKSSQELLNHPNYIKFLKLTISNKVMTDKLRVARSWTSQSSDREVPSLYSSMSKIVIKQKVEKDGLQKAVMEPEQRQNNENVNSERVEEIFINSDKTAEDIKRKKRNELNDNLPEDDGRYRYGEKNVFLQNFFKFYLNVIPFGIQKNED
ncbi:hypothetical protein BpHYR1_050318, partial [Brachionus plicatilis]